METNALADQAPQITAAVVYVWLIVKVARAWLPARVGQYVDGTRVWALVFLAALVVTWLTNDAVEVTRELFVQAITLTVGAIGGDNIVAKLDEARAGQAVAVAVGKVAQAPRVSGVVGAEVREARQAAAAPASAVPADWWTQPSQAGPAAPVPRQGG